MLEIPFDNNEGQGGELANEGIRCATFMSDYDLLIAKPSVSNHNSELD